LPSIACPPCCGESVIASLCEPVKHKKVCVFNSLDDGAPPSLTYWLARVFSAGLLHAVQIGSLILFYLGNFIKKSVDNINDGLTAFTINRGFDF
jgi:hypothetical protein